MRGLLRMSEGPSAAELQLRKMAQVLSKKARQHKQWLKKRMLKAYLVLPGQIKELRRFENSWRRMNHMPVDDDDELQLLLPVYVPVPANYTLFFYHTSNYIRKVRTCLFWRESMSNWGRQPTAGICGRKRNVRSPYFDDWQPFNPQHDTGISADHSRGSADGANTWLDRFLIATDELCRTELLVRSHPQMVRLRQGADEPIEPDLLTRITVLKAEYAAVYALSLWSPETRIPDPSRVGRDPESKWFADGGTFVVWRSERDGYVPLQDPQGVQAELLRIRADDDDEYENVLDNFGRLLVHLPGDFGDFGARIAAKLASLEAEMTRIVLVAHANERLSPFWPADESDKSDEAGAAAVPKPAVGGKKRR